MKCNRGNNYWTKLNNQTAPTILMCIQWKFLRSFYSFQSTTHNLYQLIEILLKRYLKVKYPLHNDSGIDKSQQFYLRRDNNNKNSIMMIIISLRNLIRILKGF